MFKRTANVVLGLVCALGIGTVFYARADQQGIAPNTPKPGIQAGKNMMEYDADTVDVLDQNTGECAMHGHTHIRLPEATFYADSVKGNFRSELVCTGHAKIVLNGVAIHADTIHLFPRTQSYRLDKARL
jgi:hypothetical protein